MSDQARMRELRKTHVETSIVLDEAAENLIALQGRIHGPARTALLHLARFLEGDAEGPFPVEVKP